MFRVVTLFLIFLSSTFANSLLGTYEVYAPSIYSDKDEVIAEGGVVIYNQNSTFSADKIIYNQVDETLELIGDVYVSSEDSKYTKNDYLKIDFKKDLFSGDKLFFYDDVSDLWIKSNRAVTNKKKYILKDASISSCDVKNPDWQFRFKKGVYRSDKEYVTLNHPTFYLKNVPVFYLPWFAFPTSTTRHSGLLRPFIGFENSENLLFVQPIFVSPYKNWDIEFAPQLRLKRGVGLYTTLRFVDTNHSLGSVTYGIFDEKKDYQKKHNLKNSVHQGLEIRYENSELLRGYIKDHGYKNALLIDYTNLSDIDYINLKHNSTLAVNKLVTSKLNYYVADEKHYAGLYAKYFIDTEKLDNDDTLQTLPSFQYHRFIKKMPIDNFLYGVDYKFKNSYRKRGLRATQHEISLPFIFSKGFYNDFVNFSISENLYYSRVNYKDANESIEDANYFSNYHNISLSSDLSKKHKSFIHNMQLRASYIVPSFEDRSGYFADFIPFNLEQKSLLFKMNNYFYNLDGFDFLTHRLGQNIYLEKKDDRFDDLENEIIYKYSKNLTLQNTLIYSHEYKKLKKIQSGLYYNDAYSNIRLDHTYTKEPKVDDVNFLTADVSRKIDRKYSFSMGLDYDFGKDFTKEWRFGWRMKKSCWDYELSFRQSVTPILTSGGTKSFTKRGVYLYVKLANIGGVELKNEKNFELKE